MGRARRGQYPGSSTSTLGTHHIPSVPSSLRHTKSAEGRPNNTIIGSEGFVDSRENPTLHPISQRSMATFLTGDSPNPFASALEASRGVRESSLIERRGFELEPASRAHAGPGEGEIEEIEREGEEGRGERTESGVGDYDGGGG